MCGSYTLIATEHGLVERFAIDQPPADFEVTANDNAAPTQTLPIVRAEGEHNVLVPMRWGLIPCWAKDARIGSKMINARAEGIEDKSSFRHSFRTKRCLTPRHDIRYAEQ